MDFTKRYTPNEGRNKYGKYTNFRKVPKNPCDSAVMEVTGTTVTYSTSNTSLLPNQSNYATVTAAFKETLPETGQVIREFTDTVGVFCNPLTSPHIVDEYNRIYWNKDVYGAEVQTNATRVIFTRIIYENKEYPLNTSFSILLAANYVISTHSEKISFFAYDNLDPEHPETPLTEVNVGSGGSEYSFTAEVKRTQTLRSGVDITGITTDIQYEYDGELFLGSDIGIQAAVDGFEIPANSSPSALTGYFALYDDLDALFEATIPVTQAASAGTLDYLAFEILSGGTITWEKYASTPSKTISYSKNSGATWTSITSTTGGTSISVSAGDIVLFKGTNDAYASGTANYSRFGGTAKFNLSGNILSLIYGDNFTTKTGFTSDSAFGCLFLGNEGVVNASGLTLPSSVTSYCYSNMFNNCSSMITAPELPATTLASNCYQAMFMRCSSLTEAPELPASSLTYECYKGMFKECTSLTTAPELRAGTLSYGCYNEMFSGCTNLNYIKCLATNPSTGYTSSYTSGWTAGVAATGAFIKASGVTWRTNSPSGIPAGWLACAEGEGVVISPSSASVGYTGGTITIKAAAESSFTVTTPASWITLSASAATAGYSEFTVTVAENASSARTALIVFENDEYVGEIMFTLSQAAGAGDNFIKYTTTDGQPLTMNAATWAQNIVNHTYGTIEFDDDVTVIPANAFSGQTTLATITLPSTITSIGASAFRYTSGLTMNFDTRNYPNLASIGGTAFQASNLSGCSIYIGSGLTLGTAVFGATNIVSAYTDSTTTGTTSELGPNLPQIRSIHFGPHITHLQNLCSNGGANLVELMFESTTAPSFKTNVFAAVGPTGVITYPAGSNYSAIIAKLPSGWTARTDWDCTLSLTYGGVNIWATGTWDSYIVYYSDSDYNVVDYGDKMIELECYDILYNGDTWDPALNSGWNQYSPFSADSEFTIHVPNSLAGQTIYLQAEFGSVDVGTSYVSQVIEVNIPVNGGNVNVTIPSF